MRQVHPAADLFPLLEGDDYAALVEDIRVNGLREPIWIDKSGKVLDGRNRQRACKDSGVMPAFRTYEGDDPIGFVLSLNLHRRHLSASQRAMLALEVERLEAVEAEKRRVSARSRVETVPHEEGPKARDEAGKRLGVSGRYVQTAKEVEQKAPDLAEQVRDGSMPLSRASRIIRDREAESKRVERARAEATETEVATVDIRHGDFREVLADLENVDAIITDPPYPAEFLPLLADLAAFADKVLTDDGVLAVLIGQTHLDKVYRLLDGHRPYRWTACYLTEGAGYVSHPRRVQSNWKPLLVYGGGPRFADVVRTEASDADAKNNHKWGQDYGAFHTIIERLTLRGQTVVDPFMGSGTTLLAAWAQGRNVIGCDIDAASIERARERLT